MNIRIEDGYGDRTRRSTDEGWRQAIVGFFDLAAWPAALAAGYSFYGMSAIESPQPTVALIAMLAFVAFSFATGLRAGRFAQFTFEEAGAVAVSAGAAGVTTAAAEYVLWNDSRSGQIIIMSTSIAVTLMLGHRYLRRVRANRIKKLAHLDRVPVIVYGAGSGGHRAVQTMQSSGSDYRPVALIDDDPAKRSRRIAGIRVEGGIEDLKRVARRHNARAVLLAMPTATANEMRELHERINWAGLDTLVMPPVQRIVGGINPRELTTYSDEELLNRQIIEIEGPADGSNGSGGTPPARPPAPAFAGWRHPAPSASSSPRNPASLTATRPRVRTAAALDDTLDLERLDEVFARQTPSTVARRVLVVGAGGHARVCLEALLAADDTFVVGAVSHDGSGLDELGIPVLGLDIRLDTVAERRQANTFCIAIGDNQIRRRIGRMLIEAGHDLTTVVSAAATVSTSANLAAGVQILPGATVNAAARLGEGTIVNTNASVDHDCRIGDYAHIAPGVALGGSVSIGDGALIGIGARVLPGVKIGEHAIVGGGAVVIADVADGATVVGVPARPLVRSHRRA